MPQFFPSLDGIVKLFSRPATAASLWIHLLCINLFAARWAYFDGAHHSHHVCAPLACGEA